MRRQPQARQRINVGHESTGVGTGDERFGRFSMLTDEGFANLWPDFERRLTDCRAKPDHHVFRLNLQAVGSRFQHAGRQTTLTRMRGSNPGAVTAAEQRGQAIGGHDGTGYAGRVRPAGIGFHDARRIRMRNDHTVHLA